MRMRTSLLLNNNLSANKIAFPFSAGKESDIFGKQFGAHFFPPRLPNSDIFSWHASSNFVVEPVMLSGSRSVNIYILFF
jgi:hypothetical protein